MAQDFGLKPCKSASPLPLQRHGVRRTPSVNDRTGHVAWAAEVPHRGQRIRDTLLAWRGIRRTRRQRHTRYRAARCDTRRRPEGWLPPSLEARVSDVLTWVSRLCRLAPVGAVSQELVRFAP
jgi:hypothetical protein